MAIPCTIQDLERKKFVECPTGSSDPAVRTKICQDDGESISVVYKEKGTVTYLPDTQVIASGASATMINLIVPVGKVVELESIEASGDAYALFDVKVNNTSTFKKRTYYTYYNVEFNLGNKKLVESEDIKITITNRFTESCSFDATLTYRIYDAS